METQSMIDLIKPNLPESIGLLVALIILIVGIVIIRRAHRRNRWVRPSSPAHRRAMEIRRQKSYEELPPGQW